MNWTAWSRQGHRWLSIVFTVTVAANFVVRALEPGEPPRIGARPRHGGRQPQ